MHRTFATARTESPRARRARRAPRRRSTCAEHYSTRRPCPALWPLYGERSCLLSPPLESHST
eukprot:40272-Prymnesium_polylepis.2